MRGVIILLLSSLVLFAACKSDSSATTRNTSGDSALDALKSELAKNPQDAQLLYEIGQYHYKNENYDPAIENLKAAISIDSLQADYHHLLSDTYMDYYRSKDALLAMLKAGELFPERTPTLLKLSETQLILKQYEESLFTIARVLTYDPSNADAHFMTGMNFREIGETNRAINAFKKATEQNPEMTEAWLLIGDLLYEKEDPSAIDYYDAAINIDANNPLALHSKAFYLQNHGKELEAIDLYRKINLLDKNYTDAYLNTGILYITMDSLDLAMEQFTIMAGIKPQNHLPYYYMGLVHEANGDLQAAHQSIQDCLNLKADFSDAKKALNRITEGS